MSDREYQRGDESLWYPDGVKMVRSEYSPATAYAFGKALEDLRSSLFNELRSSEGARRHQQCICGPMVALTFNFLVSVGIILMNKLVLGKVGFDYPILLTFIHYVVSWFLMAILNTLSMLPASPTKATRFSSLFALVVVMSLSTGLANVSLKYNSVGFYQMAKIAVTPSIVVAEFILMRKKVSFQKLICTVTPASSSMEETHNTLKFASRAKRVEIIAASVHRTV